MNRSLKFIAVGLLACIASALVYWQVNKKTIVRQAIQSAVQKGSDSLYSIRYDSSRIDELAGNADFFNLRLQSDSLYSILKSDSTQQLPAIVYVNVKQLGIRGANIPSLLTGNTIEANEIFIEQPHIHITLPPGDSVKLSAEDSAKLYERLTGNFNSIKAGKITVSGGNVLIRTGTGPVHTSIKGVNINIPQLKIDSTRDYNNLLSYFIKDAEAVIDTIILLPKKSGRTTRIEGIVYSAPRKFLTVNRFSEMALNGTETVTEINNSGFANLSTADFIRRNSISADTLYSSGGKLKIEMNTGGNNKDLTSRININTDYFNKINVRNLRFERTDVIITDRDKNKPIAKLNGITLNVAGIDELKFSFSLPWILKNSNWIIAGDGVELPNNNTDYRTEIGRFKLDKPASTATLGSIKIIPKNSDEAFMSKQKHQTDHYRISFSNLVFSGLNFNRLLNDQAVYASKAIVQPDLYIYNDRTLPPDLSSKVGKYPQQMLQKLDVPININRLEIAKGKVLYRERGAVSRKTGDVIFTRINGSVTGFSNLEKNTEMALNAKALFLGITPLTTTWRFPMQKKNGSFNISATINGADATRFNVVTEPLGMAKIKSGTLKGLRLEMKGDDYGSAGSATVLYNDLKIIYLEEPKGKDTINKKNLLTFFANIFTKNDNPSNGKTRSNSVGIPRDTTRSFFNLVWKSIFEGVKQTAAGKSM